MSGYAAMRRQRCAKQKENPWTVSAFGRQTGSRVFFCGAALHRQFDLVALDGDDAALIITIAGCARAAGDRVAVS